MGFGTLGSFYFSAGRKMRTVQYYACVGIFRFSLTYPFLTFDTDCTFSNLVFSTKPLSALSCTWIYEIEMIIMNVLSTVPEGMLQRAPTGRRF